MLDSARMTTAEPKDPMRSQAGQDLVADRYRLTERIGQGRLGEIFAAVDEKRDRAGREQHLAVQIVSENVAGSNSLFNKLRIGYEALRSAGHPGIVNYRDLERDGSRVYLVMELLEGAPFSYVIKDAGTIPLDEARPVLRGIGDALQFLHAEGLVHGNLTPRNVFITDTLDTRLLDVVPLCATTDSSAGGTTIADDVFALASLAYQMLSGKHPFGHGTPARAGLAGLEPDRIAGLDDHQWDALRRALTPDDENAAYTAAEFLREFGVGGAEHLRAVYAEPAPAEAVPKPAGKAPPVTGRQPATVEVNDPGLPEKWPPLETDAPGLDYWRTVMLSAVLAGLGAWYFFAQPGELIAELDPEGEQLEHLEPLPEDDIVAVDAELSTEPEIAEVPVAETLAEPIRQPTAVPEVVEEVPEASEPQVGFTESVAIVSEKSAIARVRLWREAGFDTPLVWWTSDKTASADSDYVPVPEQLVDGTNGDTLSIPLVNDNLPEQRESFYVDVGVWQPQGQIELLASIRIDIVDDDLR